MASLVKIRSSTTPLTWELCIFYQENSHTLHSVSTFSTSNGIKSADKFDQKLILALGECNDLTAAEGKHQLRCYSSFVSKSSNVKISCCTKFGSNDLTGTATGRDDY